MALDLGSQLGWATFDEPDAYHWGTVVLTDEAHLTGHAESVMALRSLLDWTNPVRIAFESVRGHRGTSAAHRYGALVGALAAWAKEHGVGLFGASPQAIKRHATGNSRASKSDMMNAAMAKWGKRFEFDDAADARWLLDLVQHG